MDDIYKWIFIFGAQYSYLIVIMTVFIWVLMQPVATKRRFFILICICLPLAFIISKIVSHFYYNPRPFILNHSLPLIPHQADNGFPSHHTLLASVISAVIFIFNRRLSFVLWVLTLFVGISRIYVGVHHPIDIAGSILISITVVILTSLGIKYYSKKSIG